MARSFLGGEFAGGESAWWRGDWIPFETSIDQLCSVLNQNKALAQSRVFKLGAQKSNQGLGHHIFQKYKDDQQN